VATTFEPRRPADGAAPLGDTAAPPLSARWLGRLPYREAWDLQRDLAQARAAGLIDDQLLLLEHEPVLTLGREADAAHVRASSRELRSRGIEVIRVERGGEVTYHGPGQLVAYPILALGPRHLLLRPLVRALEAAMADTCATYGVAADRREGHPGCWVALGTPEPRKIGALGLRVERGVTYHGIALNVTTDLLDFGLIDPCGMPEVISTSIAEELGRTAEAPSTRSVGDAAAILARALGRHLGAPIVGPLPPDADPATQRTALTELLAATSPRGS
jgi:lipoyl(octanoyl) transferase